MRGFNHCLIALLLFTPAAAAGADSNSSCLVMGKENESTLKTPERPAISEAAASYVVRHVENACRIISDATGQGAPLESIAAPLKSTVGDLYSRILVPIFKSHPDLATGGASPDRGQASLSEKSSRKVYRATKKDISRPTARWLHKELLQAQQSMLKVSSEFFAQAPEQKTAQEKLEAIVDAAAEVSAAAKVVSDAYPDVWAKQINAAKPKQDRTAESDAAFRKSTMPKGSVKLTARAMATVKSFMRQARIAEPKEDYVASIGWVIGQRSRGPEDTRWTDLGPGLSLGAYSRSEVPPDVVDKVQGMEIIFTADSPSRLAGKTIDFQNNNFIILENIRGGQNK